MNILKRILNYFGFFKQESEEFIEQDMIESESVSDESECCATYNSQLPIPEITQFTLNPASNSAAPLVFDRLQTIDIPEGYECIPMTKNERRGLYDVVSSGMALGTQGMLIQNGLNGLYQATAPVSQLMHLSSGGISSMQISESGRIVAQRGFVQASGTTFSPIIVFQVLSMVTGQYYMNGITKQLNALNEKIDTIINKIEASYQGKLQSAISFFQILAKQNSYSIDDLILLRMRLIDIQDMYFNYIIQMRKAAEKVKQEWLGAENWTNAGELLSALSILRRSDFFYLNDMAQGISVASQIGELIYVKLLSKLGTDSLSLDKLNDILLSFNGYNTQSANRIHHGIHQELKDYFISTLAGYANDAEYKSDTAQERFFEIKKLFIDSEGCYYSETQQEITQLQKALSTQFNRPEELLFDCSQPGDVYVYHKRIA